MASPPVFAQAQVADPLEADQLNIARETIEQLLAEDENIGLFRGYQGHDFVLISTRPRPSREGGLCELDVLIIERAREAPTSEGRGAIREVKAERSFYVVADANEQPTWDVHGEDLERICTAIHPDHDRWLKADDPNVAESVVAGIFALRDELHQARSLAIQWGYQPSNCPSASELADRIDPLDPPVASRANYRSCEPDRWCAPRC